MSKRHENLHYLICLGHEAIMRREGWEPSGYDPEDCGVDTIEVGVDLFAVRAALGEHSPEDWFCIYDDHERFETSMSVAVRALLLGYRAIHGRPAEWSECIACGDEGCDRCQFLGCVPSDMLTHCPICDGDGSTPLGGTCKHCTGGTIWECDRSEIITEVQMDEAYDATERSMMGEL